MARVHRDVSRTDTQQMMMRIANWLMRLPHPLRRAIGYPLRVVPIFRRGDMAMRALKRIKQLETGGDFAAAEAVRSAALRSVHPSVTGPLWSSEGYERMRRGEMRGALEAFERGIEYLEASATFFGVSKPDRIYYGAALAACEIGELDKARDYYRRCAKLLVVVMPDLRRELHQPWWYGALDVLRARLGEPETLPRT